MERPRRCGRPVRTRGPLPKHLVTLGRRQQRQIGQGPLRGGDDRRHQGVEPSRQPGGRGPVEQLPVEVEGADQGAVPLHQVETQVELGRPRLDDLAADRQAGQVRQLELRVLQVDERLEQRCGVQPALRSQRLDQPLERQVLVSVGAEAGLAHPPQQPEEAARRRLAAVEIRPALQVRPEHQGVDEEADQPLGRSLGPVGDRRAEGEVLLTADPGEEDLDRGQDRHERGRADRPGDPCQAVHARRADPHRHATGTALAPRRPPAIDRQLEGRHAVQPLVPVGELLRHHAARLVAARLEPGALPDREVAVLDRQRLQGLRLRGPAGLARHAASGTERTVTGRQLAEDDAQGPAVGDHVVDVEHQVVALRLPAHHRQPQQRTAAEVERAAGQGVGRAVAFPIPAGCGQSRQVDHRRPTGASALRRLHHLDRLAVALLEVGPERLLARHDPRQGAGQGRQVEGARKLQPHRDVVARAARLQPVQEPQPPLGERRVHALQAPGLRQGLDRRPGRARQLRRPPGRAGDGRILEQGAERQVDAQGLAQACHQAGGAQGVAAQVEEVVVDAHPVDAPVHAEDLGEGVCHQRLRRRPRSDEGRPGAGAGTVVRSRQGGAVHLAVGVERQLLEQHEGGRHHVAGQPGAEEATEVLPVHAGARRRLPGHRVGHQAALAGPILAHHHRAAGHPRMGGEGRLDLSRLDPEAADLDLVVQAAGELDRAVRPPAGQVAGAIEPLPRRRRVRMGDEPLGGQRRPAEVAAGEAVPGDAQLPRYARRDRPERAVGHQHRAVGDGPADGHRRRPLRHRLRPRSDPVPGGEGRVLGRPVDVHQALRPAGRQDAAHGARVRRLAAEEHSAQRRERSGHLVRDLVEQGGGQEHGGHAPALQLGGQEGRVEGGLRVHLDHPPPLEQGPPELEGGGVEGGVGQVGDPVVRAELQVVGPTDQPCHAPVHDGDPLGPAGGAGGVHDVGQSGGTGTRLNPSWDPSWDRTVDRHLSALAHRAGRDAARPDDDRLHSDPLGPIGQSGRLAGRGRFGCLGRPQQLLQAVLETARDQDHRGRRVAEHEAQALDRIRRIEGHVVPAGANHSQIGGDQVRSAVHQHADRRFRADAGGDEPPRDRRRPGIQGAVAERPVPTLQGDRVRSVPHPVGEQLVEGPVALVDAARDAPLAEQLVALARRQQGDLVDGYRGIGQRAIEHHPQVAGQPRHRRPVEQVGVVLEIAGEAAGASMERRHQVELGGAGVERQGVEGEISQLEGDRRVLERAQDLDERRPAALPAGRQLLHQALERQVLVLEGVQRGPPGALERLVEARRAGEVRPQHQGVDEEADQRLDLGTGPVGDRRADRQVPLAGMTGEDHLERRQQHHERRDLLRPGELRHAVGHVPTERQGDGAPALAPRRRPRPVGRQLEGRQPGEAVAPGREQAIQHLPPKPTALPEGEVRVLDGQRRERRRLAVRERPVERRELAQEDAGRPAVGDDVVHGRRQHVALRAGGQQQGPQQRPALQVERAARLPPQQPRHLGLGPVGGKRGQVDPGQRSRTGVVHHLDGGAVRPFGEGGPQRLVATRHLGQRPGEGGRVDPALEPRRRRHVVGHPAVEPVEQPESLLGEGERQVRRALRSGDGSESDAVGASPAGLRREVGCETGRLARGSERLLEGAGQAGDGPPFEQQSQRELDAVRLANPGDHAGGQERVAAQVEEVVVSAHPVDAPVHAEDLGEGAGHQRLRRRPRSDEGRPGAGARIVVRSRQGGAVHLAVGVERQLLEQHEGGRHHVAGQPGAEEATEVLPVHAGARRRLPGHRVGHQAALAGPILAHHHRAAGHPRMGGEGRLDLSRLDPEAADLDLVVQAAGELDRTVRPPAGQVAGAIEPLPRRRRVRMGDEPLGGQRRPAEVAAGETVPGDAQLPRYTRRDRPERAVGHQHRAVGDGPADGHRRRPLRHRLRPRSDPVPGRQGRVLGRTVGVQQALRPAGRQDAAHGARVRRLAAEEHRAQRRERSRHLVRDLVEQGGGQQHDGDAPALQLGGQERRVESGFPVHLDQVPSVEQRAPELEGGGVEGGVGQVGHPVVRAELQVVGAEHQSRHAPLGDGDPLGSAGGAGGVHDVGHAG